MPSVCIPTGKTWAITGVAGFIGSHLLEAALIASHRVVGLDNLSSGSVANLKDVEARVGAEAWSRFRFYRSDIRARDALRERFEGADAVVHLAALGGVTRSIEEPLLYHDVNVTGFLNVVDAARQAGVGRIVYASSSSVYGDASVLPQVEDLVGRPISPYAATKRANEIDAAVYATCFRMTLTGLRFFNVFGPRQNAAGASTAVIPRWIQATVAGTAVTIHGDGSTTRDFTYVRNAVDASLLAVARSAPGTAEVFNVACGRGTSLADLQAMISGIVADQAPARGNAPSPPRFEAFRPGDIRHSRADLTKVADQLGYVPRFEVRRGIEETVAWHLVQPIHPRAAISGSPRSQAR